MACAVLDFEPSIIPDFSYLSHDVEADEDAPQIATDFSYESLSPAAFEAEASAALEDESTEEVDALLAFAFATPEQTYDLVARTIAGFTSQDMQHRDYVATFNAAARVALEHAHPLLFQEWLAGNDGGDIPTLVGAELAKLRPAQLVFKPLSRRQAQYQQSKRKAQNAAKFLGWS